MKKYLNILERASGLKQTIIELRRELHQHPELALQEFNTSKKLERILKEIGIETRMLVNGTGVVGQLRGSKPGKTIALRADIDALPIQEESDVPYKSKNPGVMHACGHDAHAAMLLGAASILCEMRKELNGTISFIFQPAEETGEGAKKMVEEGAIDRVDGILAFHVNSSLDSGTLGYCRGPIMAAGDFFDVKITGKGGHGGMPHLAIDPIVIAANAISALQTLVSREIDPVESAVVSICKMEAGGKAYNIIPDSATFGGTIRSHNSELREYLPRRMREILDGVVQAMRGHYEFHLTERFPVTINDDRMTDFVAKIARDVLGEDQVFEMKPLMGSEDFSYYLQKVPGSFVFFGTKSTEKGITYPLHHPRFDIDEDVLPTGAALLAALALEFLRKGSE
ncbi:MAG TPA: amidohydrolase, partial [Thermodesulfobacteriota bacterium]|nr:amidohydrolase [Thermodesulfobacteriota bacterium]